MDNVTVGLEVTGLLNSKPTGIGIYIKNLLIHLTKINVNVKLFYKITRIKNINNLRNYSNATNLIEKEIRKINTLDNDQMWKTKVINNAAFITTSLAFRRRELDNKKKVFSKKKYLTYLKKSVLNIFLF